MLQSKHILLIIINVKSSAQDHFLERGYSSVQYAHQDNAVTNYIKNKNTAAVSKNGSQLAAIQGEYDACLRARD